MSHQLAILLFIAEKSVHRTTVDIDVPAFRRARRLLGTRGYRDTVNEALRAVAHQAELQRGADLIRAGGLRLADPDELDELRRPSE